MNLYAQEQFPNMDVALTFHMGLCLRIPRSDQRKLSEIPAAPFASCLRGLQEASEALAQAQEVADYQSIGVRCREALLAFVNIAQTVMPWTGTDAPPKKADLKASADHICSGAALGATVQPGVTGALPASSLIGGLVAGVIGAVAGTFGGYEFRARLVRTSGGKTFRSLCSKTPSRLVARS
jgi:hypothetical protein